MGSSECGSVCMYCTHSLVASQLHVQPQDQHDPVLQSPAKAEPRWAVVVPLSWYHIMGNTGSPCPSPPSPERKRPSAALRRDPFQLNISAFHFKSLPLELLSEIYGGV